MGLLKPARRLVGLGGVNNNNRKEVIVMVKEGDFVSIFIGGILHEGIVRKVGRKGVCVLYDPKHPKVCNFHRLEYTGGKVKLVKESSIGNRPGGRWNVK